MRIIQLLPTIAFGDAVGNDTRAIKQLLKSEGYTTEIYAENIDPRLPRGEALPVAQIPRLAREDVLIYHLSVGSALNGRMDSFPCRKIMIYHNITPPHFFEGYCPPAQELSARGLREMEALRHSFDYCLADSAFNRQNLLDAGYTCPIDVLPVLIPFSDYRNGPDAAAASRLSDGRTNVIFVGRVAPHKKQENVIRAFFHYKRDYDRSARLLLVGAADGMERYLGSLRAYAASLGLKGDDVEFFGHVSFATILAVYRTAHLFLCMSEHEGFCVPLVEAMMFDVPVIAYAACAIPGTLADSGILLDTNEPVFAAAVMNRLMTEDVLWREIIERQRRRLRDFSEAKVGTLFKERLNAFLEGRIET